MRHAASFALGLGLSLCASLTLADDGKRELKAHQHGRGTLGLAIDGNRVELELDAPAADILGFESAATTPEQRATLAAAKARLADPLSLFVLPAAAGCTVTRSEIELETAGDHDHGGTDHDKNDHDKHDHAKHNAAEAGHADVEADYELTCTNPAALTAVDFAYFAAFKGAESLTVNVVTAKGQSQSIVSRAEPRLALGGLM